MTFAFEFTAAERRDVLLRVLLCAESGHGKTYTALALLHHMGVPSEQIAFVDSETQVRRVGGGKTEVVGSAEKYVGEHCDCHHCQGHGIVFGKFAQLKLPPEHREPDDYRKAIRAAEAAGFRALIVDSISHEWTACKRMVDRLKPKFRGNQWAAWSEVTPRHDGFLQALLDFPGHVVACTRGKEKTEQVGKEIRSRGLLPLQRDGIEFEFDVWFNLHRQVAHVAKTRAKRLNGRDFQHPGKELAEELLAWAGGGTAAEDRLADQRAKLIDLAKGLAPELEAAVGEKVNAARDERTLAAIEERVRAKLQEIAEGMEEDPGVKGDEVAAARESALAWGKKLPEGEQGEARERWPGNGCADPKEYRAFEHWVRNRLQAWQAEVEAAKSRVADQQFDVGGE